MMSLGYWRYRRFHVSYLLGWLAFGVLSGLWLAKLIHLELSLVGLVIFVVLSLPALRSRRWWTTLMIVAIGMTIGLSRGGLYQDRVAEFTPLFGSSVGVHGVITDDPQGGVKGTQVFQLGDLLVDGNRLPGEIYVTVQDDGELKRGDLVGVSGKLKEGFATYHGTITFAQVESVARSPDIIRDLRERFIASVRSSIAEPMASLGIGFVVGQRTALPQDLDEQLKVVGLTHIVVASGYNLTILVRFARRVLAKRSRYLAFAFSMILMLAFVSFSGLSPSMNRAVIVTGLSLLAWYYGRRFHPLLLIGYVAAGTALWNPVYIWSDLGWYLSFFAFAGVLIIAPLIAAVLFKTKQSPATAQLVIETLSAELMTLPLIAFIFGVFPTFGLISNTLVGPFIPLAMVTVAMSGITGMLFPVMSSIVAVPASVIVGYMIAVVEWLAAIEWAQLDVTVTLSLVIIWFLAIIAGAVYVWRRWDYNFRSSAITD